MNSVSSSSAGPAPHAENPHSLSKSVWDEFYRLSTLSVTFAHSTSSTAYIYGNGRNQVAVTVSLKIISDNAGNKLSLTADEIYDAIYLCDYNTGEEIELPTRTADVDPIIPDTDDPFLPIYYSFSPWSYTRYENEFHNAISYQAMPLSASEGVLTDLPAVRDSSVDTVTLYISCSETSDGKPISVGINVPGVGRFDTSKNGTTTINAPSGGAGSVFKSPSHVGVIAQQAINYSDSSNITIEYGDYVILSESQWYVSRILLTEYNHHDGIAKRKIVRLKSGKGYPFLSHSLTYNPIEPKEPSTGTDSAWSRPGMAALTTSPGLPCAVMGRQMSDEKFYAFFWFSRQNKVIFSEGWLSQRWTAGRYYKCFFNTDVSEEHRGDDEQGAATLLLYTFVCHEHNTDRLYWDNTYRRPEVSVTDSYGNTGTFYLTFSDADPEAVGIE